LYRASVLVFCAGIFILLGGCVSSDPLSAPEGKGAELQRARAGVRIAKPVTRSSKLPLFLAHYMPWFQAPPFSDNFGWHWHMGSTDPYQKDAHGLSRIAAHYYPLTGPYDSDDPDLLEYQTSLMKASGVDGVIVDWYGTSPSFDYPQLQKSSEAVSLAVKKARLKFAICYEDQSVARRVESQEIDSAAAADAAKADMSWAARVWFKEETYLKIRGRPVVLCFGPQYFKEDRQWDVILSGIDPRPLLITLDGAGGSASDGSYPWPPMGASSGGTLSPDALVRYLNDFYGKNLDKPFLVSSAFPGFHDFYSQAGVRPSYGYLDDYLGETFGMTLDAAVSARADVVQLVTWNDYGEGTMIEPTVQNGYRELETLQELRRRLDPSFSSTREDLRAPLAAFKARVAARTARMAPPAAAASDAAKPADPFAAAVNLALHRPMASHNHIFAFTAEMAVDGDTRTYWEGARDSYPNEITVDLGAPLALAAVRIKLNPPRIWGARTQTFAVLASTEGERFVPAAQSRAWRFDPAAGGNTVTIPIAATARFIKLSFSANDGATAGQVAELEVFGR